MADKRMISLDWDANVGERLPGEVHEDLATTYATAFPDTTIVTDPATGNVMSVTENGVTTTYTYGPNGVATDTRLGVTRTYTYDGSGNLTGIAS